MPSKPHENNLLVREGENKTANLQIKWKKNSFDAGEDMRQWDLNRLYAGLQKTRKEGFGWKPLRKNPFNCKTEAFEFWVFVCSEDEQGSGDDWLGFPLMLGSS